LISVFRILISGFRVLIFVLPEIRARKTEINARKPEIRTRKTEINTRKPEIRIRKTEINTQKQKSIHEN
jgi:hypothetical protein